MSTSVSKSHRYTFSFYNMQQGGAEHSGDCTQRSYPLVPEAGPAQPCVSAFVKNIASSFYQDHRLFG